MVQRQEQEEELAGEQQPRQQPLPPQIQPERQPPDLHPAGQENHRNQRPHGREKDRLQPLIAVFYHQVVDAEQRREAQHQPEPLGIEWTAVGDCHDFLHRLRATNEARRRQGQARIPRKTR